MCDAAFSLGMFWILVCGPLFYVFAAYFTYKLPPIFDGDLFKEIYFHRNQKFLPLYRVRRAGIYALCVALPKRSAVIFPGHDLQGKLSHPQVLACRAFLVLLVVSLLIPLVSLLPHRFFCS